jgi:hypothetical protein
MKNWGKLLLVTFALFFCASCSKESTAQRNQKPKEMALSDVNLPGKPARRAPPINEKSVIPEGSRSEVEVEGHPTVGAEQKQQRAIVVPKEVEGKWQAVKLVIKDKQDDEKVEVKTVNLGESFVLADANLTVTVGAFFPNFVMDKVYYTSLGNELKNPAVQFVVHENEKRIFEGWAFKRFPKLYAFKHDKYKILLTDFIPKEVS